MSVFECQVASGLKATCSFFLFLSSFFECLFVFFVVFLNFDPKGYMYMYLMGTSTLSHIYIKGWLVCLNVRDSVLNCECRGVFVVSYEQIFS